MTIFKTYTGNAMLNNALMTIEALADLQSIEEITPELLLSLYKQIDLKSLNKRLKSYTMLFTKNGPLHNDKTNGDRVYDSLFKTIVKSYENEGDRVCEISGLRFSKTFDEIYQEALREAGLAEKEIKKKDTTLNRAWFPLTGGLGSDAQALPQAKFSVQVHPVCVAILQFLPLSSLLYNGGILLVDSSNFDFAKSYVQENQKLLWEKIKATPVNQPIGNVRDFNKGNYILKAIEILKNKEAYEETYSDLNLWSFSNSGTGASCSIDRVPNSLIRQLMTMDKNSKIGAELKGILNNNKSSSSFLEDLEANKEWWLLYPNVFGSGKKAEKYPGVSVDFLEAYFEVTGNEKLTEYAKYIAGLIGKYKTKTFEKYLGKYDAWNEKEYRVDLYTVLVAATEKGEWDLQHQIQILDEKNRVPVKNNYYHLHKLVHFYYQKEHFNNALPPVYKENFSVLIVCDWLIKLIEKDINRNKIISDLTNRNNYALVSYSKLLLRAIENCNILLEDVAIALYDDHFRLSVYGMNELMRIYFTQSTRENLIEENTIVVPHVFGKDVEEWFNTIKDFTIDYRDYYYEKYKNRDTDKLPVGKFKNLIKHISLETSGFLQWFREALNNVNEFVLNANGIKDKWKEEDLLFNPNGEISLSFSKLAIKLLLTKQSQTNIKEQLFQQS